MWLIDAFYPRLMTSGEPGRAPFKADELLDLGLDHPSRRQVRDILSQAPRFLWPSAFSLAIFLAWNISGFLFLAIAWTVRYLSVLSSALLEYVNFYRWNRPDVFIGWNYGAIEDDIVLPVPPLGKILVENLKPFLGAVLVIPAANTSSLPAIVQDLAGNRGVFLPCLQVADAKWKPAVAWILGQVRAAVFEISVAGKPSLDWEVAEAIRLLGPERVLLVTREPSGCTVASAARQTLVRPIGINNLHPHIPAGTDMEAVAMILEWCADHLYVRPKDALNTRIWFWIYNLEPAVIRFAKLFVTAFIATGITLIALSVWQAGMS